ncbi:MAG: 16S rRNA (cytidine(1402)-2'-O)-methyltransferase [Candidatus Paceibacterota bacterium]|jgi:16S rRNA (cytidine1402-2'-O)-methyltransferase
MSFYIVPTPIGNLEDITLRAIRILKECDLILCEDTRETRKLLNHYEIKTATQSYHAQSKLSRIDDIIKDLEDGKNIALVSDAGTPAISDPGSLLISKIREALPEQKIESLPGPSALTAAFAASGVLGGEFTFLGFLPHKKGRETLFKEIAASDRPSVFYESPHRILKTLESLKKFAPEKRVVVAKEISKIYEEYITGTAEVILEYFAKNPDKTRGEFVVIVGEGRKVV